MIDESPPSLPPDPDDVPDSILTEVSSYLGKKGTIELFAQFSSPVGKQFKELIANVDLSAGSLSRRLEDGQKLGLIDVRNVREDGRNKQKYYATGLGDTIAKAALRAGIYELNRQLLEMKETRDTRREEIIQRLKDGDRKQLAELSPSDLPDHDVPSSVSDSE